MGSATGNQTNLHSQGQSVTFYALTLAVIAFVLIGLHITYRAWVAVQNQPTPHPTMQTLSTLEPIFATLTAQPTTVAPTIQPASFDQSTEDFRQRDSIGWQIDTATGTLSTISNNARLNLAFTPTTGEIMSASYPTDLILSFWHQRDFPFIGGGRFSVDWRLNRNDEWRTLWQYIGGMSGAGLVTAPSFKQHDWEYIEVSLAPIANELPDDVLEDSHIELSLHVITPQAGHGVQVQNLNLNNRQLRTLPAGFIPDQWRHSSDWQVSPDQSMFRYSSNQAGFHVMELIPLIDLRNYSTRDTITLTYAEQGRLGVGDRAAVQIRFEVDEPLTVCPDQRLQCYGQVYHWSQWETPSTSIVNGQTHLNDWRTVTVDIAPYASTDSKVGRRIQIRFVYQTQGLHDDANWAWRDVRLSRIAQAESFSSSP